MGVHAGHAGYAGHAGHVGHAGPVPSPGQAAVRLQQCSQVPSQRPKLFPPSSNPHADSAHQVSSVPAFLQLVPVQELGVPSQAVPRGCAPTLVKMNLCKTI